MSKLISTKLVLIAEVPTEAVVLVLVGTPFAIGISLELCGAAPFCLEIPFRTLGLPTPPPSGQISGEPELALSRMMVPLRCRPPELFSEVGLVTGVVPFWLATPLTVGWWWFWWPEGVVVVVVECCCCCRGVEGCGGCDRLESVLECSSFGELTPGGLEVGVGPTKRLWSGKGEKEGNC